ncbi:hypothetical protein J6590_081861, partial [Homalodisca vitripennis]
MKSVKSCKLLDRVVKVVKSFSSEESIGQRQLTGSLKSGQVYELGGLDAGVEGLSMRQVGP